MTVKSKQCQAEEIKTISITELTQLRFRVLNASRGVIEIVNCQDMGRVCSVRLTDFKSVSDAQVYAQLLVLAPKLLAAYLSDPEKLKQVVKRFEKRMDLSKRRKPKPKKVTTR